MMTTLLSILIGFQLVQTVALVVLVRLTIKRYKVWKRTEAENNEMVVRIKESRRAHELDENAWFLYEPGSINHPAASKSVDRFQKALGAIEYADSIYPGVRIQITDAHFYDIPVQDVRDGTRVEAS